MAGEKEGQDKDHGGGAVDGLTPPTMKYDGPGEQTQIGSANTLPGAQQNTIQATPNTIPGGATPTYAQKSRANTISNEMGPDTAPLNVAMQDLSGERLLMAAPRKESHGKQCPALNDIPLLAKIGQGGMGAVYYGIHPRLRSEVAVKVLPFHLAEQDPGMIRRFFREAQIAAQVRSPHLVNVMDVNEEAGLFFLVMEFVAGCTAGHYLKQLIEKTQTGMPEKDMLDLTIAATEGLWAAHAQGVVHRDIKPENIMIPYASKASKDYDLRRAKLMDLGLARSEESNQSLTGAQAAMGTPGYMAPEQAMDAKTADKRSDVFSMGASMYALLTGRPPFKGETIMKVLMATMHEPHEPVIKLRPDISPMLNEILERCLTKKQETRFADAKQLLTALEDCRRLIGDGGAGAMSGVKTYVYQGGNTPAPATTQATLAGAIPADANAAPQKSKGTMLIAAGVAAVALAGGAFMFMRGGDEPVKPEITDKAGQKPAFGDKELEVFRKTFPGYIEPALKAAKEGDKVTAEVYLSTAQGLPVAKLPEFKEQIDKVVAAIADLDKKELFKTSIKQVDDFILKGQLKEAQAALSSSRVNAVEKDLVDQFDKRQKQLIDLNKEAATKKLFAEKVASAIQLKNEKKIVEALGAVTEALKLNPNDFDAGKLATELKTLKEEKDKNEKYELLLKEVETAFKGEKFQDASSKAIEAQMLVPGRAEAAKWLKDIGPKLKDAEKQQQIDEYNRQRKKQFDDAMVAAGQFYQDGKLDDAAAQLRSALAIDPENAGALETKRLVDAALADKMKVAEAQKKKRDFEELVSTATNLIKSGSDLALAKQKLEDAGKIFPNDQASLAAVQAVEQQLRTKRDELKKQTEFEDLYTKAGKAATDDRSLDDASAFIAQALAIFPNDKPAQNLQKLIKQRKDDQLAKMTEQKNKEGQYNQLITKADGLLKEAESKAMADRIRDYETAQQFYKQAKDLIPKFGKAEEKESDVLKKIADARAAETQRRQIDGKIEDADRLATRGDYAGALAILGEAKKISADDAKLKQKLADLMKLQLESDKVVGAAIELAKSKLLKSALAEAIQDARAASQRYAARSDISAVAEGLLQTQTALNDADGKLRTLDARAGGKSFSSRTRVTSARDKIYQLAVEAVNKLSTANLGDASATMKRLETDIQQQQLTELTPALTAYESEIASASKPVRVGDDNPYEDKRKPKNEGRQPKVKPVGDSNPFD